MRTTLVIDDDILEVARSLSRTRGLSLGRAISELARRGLEPRSRVRYRNHFPTFEVAENAPPVTPEQVRAALEDDDT